MKINVLVDNNTKIENYLEGEPGLSFYIESDGTKILFDTGYSDLFIRNANKLDVKFLDLDYVILSHGHLDHTWGLVNLIKLFNESLITNRKISKPALITHPESLAFKKSCCGSIDGNLLSYHALENYFKISLCKKSCWLNEKLLFLGEIGKHNSFENENHKETIIIDHKETIDNYNDDSALVYLSENGLVIITGCSHSGICNIIEQAKILTGEKRIADVIGGFHLLDASEERLENTAKYLKENKITAIQPSHCTDLKAKIFLSSYVDVAEVWSGKEIVYN